MKQTDEEILVRDINDIEECKHLDPSKHIYITNPKIFISIIVLIAYILGLLTFVAIIVAAVAFVFALISGIT